MQGPRLFHLLFFRMHIFSVACDAKHGDTKETYFPIVTAHTNPIHRHAMSVVFSPVAGRDHLAYSRGSFYALLLPPLRDHIFFQICCVFFDFVCFCKGGKYSHIWRTETKKRRARPVAQCAIPCPQTKCASKRIKKRKNQSLETSKNLESTPIIGAPIMDNYK